MLKRMFLVINLSVLVFFGMSSPYSKINVDDKFNSLKSSVQILENQSYIENEVIVTLNSEISGFEEHYTNSIFRKFNSGDVKHITKFRLMQENIIDYKEDFVKWKRKL